MCPRSFSVWFYSFKLTNGKYDYNTLKNDTKSHLGIIYAWSLLILWIHPLFC